MAEWMLKTYSLTVDMVWLVRWVAYIQLKEYPDIAISYMHSVHSAMVDCY